MRTPSSARDEGWISAVDRRAARADGGPEQAHGPGRGGPRAQDPLGREHDGIDDRRGHDAEKAGGDARSQPIEGPEFAVSTSFQDTDDHPDRRPDGRQREQAGPGRRTSSRSEG